MDRNTDKAATNCTDILSLVVPRHSAEHPQQASSLNPAERRDVLQTNREEEAIYTTNRRHKPFPRLTLHSTYPSRVSNSRRIILRVSPTLRVDRSSAPANGFTTYLSTNDSPPCVYYLPWDARCRTTTEATTALACTSTNNDTPTYRCINTPIQRGNHYCTSSLCHRAGRRRRTGLVINRSTPCNLLLTATVL